MKYFFYLIIFLTVTGCCTKKKCAGYITITLVSFTQTELSQTSVDIYEAGSNLLVQSYSAGITVQGQTTIISPDHTKEMRNFYFVIKTPVTTDTIYKINYEIFTQKINCNTCFPIPQKETIKSFGNFSFYHKGTPYFSTELTINK
jgi:hypothetical protein